MTFIKACTSIVAAVAQAYCIELRDHKLILQFTKSVPLLVIYVYNTQCAE